MSGGQMHRAPRIALLTAVSAIYCFMLGPILITAIVSFSGANSLVFPPSSWSLRWWGEAFAQQWFGPFMLSLRLGIGAAALSTALALPLAFALVRHEFRGRSFLVALTLGPLLLPTLATGIGILQMLSMLGLYGILGFWALLMAHAVICLPLSVRAIAGSLNGLPKNAELAAASLGADPWRVRATILLPLIRNGFTGGFVFAFIHSFTDVNTSLFLSRPLEQPVTIMILGSLQYGFVPTIAAVAMLTIAVPLVAVAILERMGGFGGVTGGPSR